MATGCLETPDTIPAQLETLDLTETTADGETRGSGCPGLLAQLATEVDPASLALLVQGALTEICLAVRGPVATDRLLWGLLDCLPVDCRTFAQLFHGAEVLRAAAL